jgi:hypothetical protein
VSIVDDKPGISIPSTPLSHSFLPGGSESTQAKVKRLELIVKMECGPESGDEGAPTRVWHSVLSLLFVHREDCEAVLERINSTQTLQKTIAQVHQKKDIHEKDIKSIFVQFNEKRQCHLG